MKGGDTHMMLCDSTDGFLVTSGSAVLELESGDQISLEPTKFNSIVVSYENTRNTFTGFLIFPTT